MPVRRVGWLEPLAELIQRQTNVPQRIAFISSVVNLASDSETLFKELDGAAGLAQDGDYPGCPSICLRLAGRQSREQ